jgi:hypothetical protein
LHSNPSGGPAVVPLGFLEGTIHFLVGRGTDLVLPFPSLASSDQINGLICVCGRGGQTGIDCGSLVAHQLSLGPAGTSSTVPVPGARRPSLTTYPFGVSGSQQTKCSVVPFPRGQVDRSIHP